MDDGMSHDLVCGPPAPGAIRGGDRLSPKPDSQIAQSDAFHEAVVECLPSAGGAPCPEPGRASGSRRKPCAPRAVVGNHRARRAAGRTVLGVVIVNDAQGSGCVGVGGSRSVGSNRAPPLDGFTGDLTGGGDGHGFAFDELRAVAAALHCEANLVRKDVPSTGCEHGIGRPDEPDPGGDGQSVEHGRLSGAVVACEEGELWVQLQSVVGEELEVLYPESIDSHVPLHSEEALPRSDETHPGRGMEQRQGGLFGMKTGSAVSICPGRVPVTR